MTPELPPNPRAELEAKVTAWLLGELSADEARHVREMVEKDAELAQLRDRLSQTLNLLRETVATPVGETPVQPTPLKMSAEKREKLLASFKTIQHEEVEKSSNFVRNLFYALAAAASIAFLGSLLLPSLSRAKSKSMRGVMMNELSQIEVAKQMWADDNKKSPGSKPTFKDLLPYMPQWSGGKIPQVANETYSIGPVGQSPIAEYNGKIVALSGSPGKPIEMAALSQPTAATLDDLRKQRALEDIAPAAPAATPVALPTVQQPQNSTIYLGTPNSLSEQSEPTGPQQANTDQITLSQTRTIQQIPTGQPAGIPEAPQANFRLQTDNKDSEKTSETLSYQDNSSVQSQSASAIILSQTKTTPTLAGQFQGSLGSVLHQHGGELLRKKEAAAGKRDKAPMLTPIAGSEPPIDASAPAPPEAGIASRSENVVSTDLTAKTENRSFANNSGSDGLDSNNKLRGYGNADPDRHLNGSMAPQEFRSTGGASSGKLGTMVDNGSAAPLSQQVPRDQFLTANSPSSLASNQRLVAWSSKLHGGPDPRALIYNDAPLQRSPLPVLVPQPEVLTSTNNFTTFSLDVSDVAFKLAAASLDNGQMPDPAGMRSEEFINAFDYRDPEPAPGAPVGFAWERAADPFAQGRDLLRFSIKTAAQGRTPGRPLNLVLLLDKSGSMERADRVEIIANALRVLASQLQPNDTLSVVVFSRTARLFIDGAPGTDAGKIAKRLRDLTPEGGTNLEEAMRLAYATALRHYLANGENRVVLLTDGAANLGNVQPQTLKKSVEKNRNQGIALDCFGVGWDGYNDDLLEKLSRAGGGRYGFVNTPEEAATELAGKLAGALRVAAADVKVQVEFNPKRVKAFRQIGYAKDQLKKEDFRDNSVHSASIGAAESGTALYAIQINPSGEGPLCTVHVRFRVPGTSDYQEHEWAVPYDGSATPLENSAPSMRLAAVASSFAEWLSGSPYASDVTPDRLLEYFRGVPRIYGADPRPAKLESMIREAKSISGK